MALVEIFMVVLVVGGRRAGARGGDVRRAGSRGGRRASAGGRRVSVRELVCVCMCVCVVCARVCVVMW